MESRLPHGETVEYGGSLLIVFVPFLLLQWSSARNSPNVSTNCLAGRCSGGGGGDRAHVRHLGGPSPELNADSIAHCLISSKNRNEVRPTTFVAGLIARSPSPAYPVPVGEDPCEARPHRIVPSSIRAPRVSCDPVHLVIG